MAKKVAIIGYTSHNRLANYDDPTTEIWGLNDLYDQIPRYTRWFEMHQRKIVDSWQSCRTNRNHLEVLRQMQCPVYMQDHYEDIPCSVKYPLQEIQDFIKQRFPGRDFNGYFTNSISYMVAMAIRESFEEIEIYGVDLAVGSEYGSQRPSCEFWLGVAAGLGAKIYIPPESDLLTSLFLYGYEDEKKAVFMSKVQQVEGDIEGKIQQATAEELRQRDWKNQVTGAKEAIRELKARWLLTEGGD